MFVRSEGIEGVDAEWLDGPRVPDFLGIGAQKAGTTWLASHLAGHRDVFVPAFKEIQYFNYVHVPSDRPWVDRHRAMHAERVIRRHVLQRADKPLDLRYISMLSRFGSGTPDDRWYRTLFAVAGENQLCGEISPSYSLLPPEGIQHAFKMNPAAKIILCVRDPIDRAWSQLRMVKRHSTGNINLAKLATSDDVIRRADYASIYDQWASVFGQKNILVIRQDDIDASPVDAMRTICCFLGIDFDRGNFAGLDQRIHGGLDDAVPVELLKEMRTRYREIYQSLVERFPWASDWYKNHYPPV